MSRWLAIILIDVERQFRGPRLHDVERRIVGPGSPVFEADTWPQKALHEGAVIQIAPASSHEDAVGTIVEIAWIDANHFRVLGSNHPLARKETRGDGQANVGSPEISTRLIRVE